MCGGSTVLLILSNPSSIFSAGCLAILGFCCARYVVLVRKGGLKPFLVTSSSCPIGVSTARFAAETNFVQLFPVVVRVVNSNLFPGLNPTRDDDDALNSKPIKSLKLGVWPAGMVDEPDEVACKERTVRFSSE